MCCASAAAPPGTVLEGRGALHPGFIGLAAADEPLLRVLSRGARPELVLRQRLDPILREAEVQLWISHGKATRDVANILGLSPRTVDKHLEQIYNKLGIANRASAASLASRLIGEAGGL